MMDYALPQINMFLKYYRKRKNQELSELLSIFHCAEPQELFRSLTEKEEKGFEDVNQAKKEKW